MSRTKNTKRKRDGKEKNYIPNKASKQSSSTIPSKLDSPPPDASLDTEAKSTKKDKFEPKSLQTIISEEELEIAVGTLKTLTRYPSAIKAKGAKELRAAVYDFRMACTTGTNNAGDEKNLTARISAALTDGKLTEALILLAEMRIRGEAPKLGAFCRWVRDLDVVSGLSMQVDGVSKTTVPRTEKDLELLRVLDSILRVTGPVDGNEKQKGGVSGQPVCLQDSWTLKRQSDGIWRMREAVEDGSIFKTLPLDVSKFEVVERTPGAARRPPNLHDAVVHSTPDGTVPLSTSHQQASYHKHPTVPNLGLIKDVLSPEECRNIIAATESVGYLPDAPIRDDGAEASILAHNVYWVVDQAFHDTLWSRVLPHLPSEIAGKKARGINRRFRVYRYVPGAEYRCHIDGAWPPSGIDPITKKYQYDASPADAKQSSLFTFLIYLNDEFKGGETTFFVPSVREGVMNAYPVRPVMGGVAVFPHGEAKGALLHEGTGVRKGAKYIIRTDVEYDVEAGRE
ncbi:prolyl 4-hydroxylase [Venturia nashicola]|nr:prolyl 4-hydroxylase [Venturia nashicola]